MFDAMNYEFNGNYILNIKSILVKFLCEKFTLFNRSLLAK